MVQRVVLLWSKLSGKRTRCIYACTLSWCKVDYDQCLDRWLMMSSFVYNTLKKYLQNIYLPEKKVYHAKRIGKNVESFHWIS